MTRTKENAYTDWFEMTFNSWTWAKLTDEEKERFTDSVGFWCNGSGSLKGDYRHRWDVLNELYYMYLLGLGYKPIGWREDTVEIPQF